jgi:hypothetical protein
MDTVTIADGIPQNPKYVSDFDFELFTVVFYYSEERFKKLVEKFKEDYNGLQPQFLCRAPGRVNLIGNIN